MWVTQDIDGFGGKPSAVLMQDPCSIGRGFASNALAVDLPTISAAGSVVLGESLIHRGMRLPAL